MPEEGSMSSHKRNVLTKSEASRLKSDGLPTHISDSESRVELSKELLDAAREIDGIAYQYSRKICLACHAPLDQIGVVYSDDKGLRRNVGCDERQVEVFENDIQKCYPLGFDFSENSKRLVEERAGFKLSVDIERELQSRMFERKDGLWFFANQICTDAVSQAVVSRCAAWLDKYPLIVLSRLGEVLIGRCENLEDSFDHGKFAEFCIRQSEKGNLYGFNGKRGNRICFKDEDGEENAKSRMAAMIRDLLMERMDAVSVSEIVDLYPSIADDWLLGSAHSLFQDVIVVDLADKAYAFKLLEHFYLPEDFGAALTVAIGDLESDGEMLSSARLLDVLNQRYSVSFLQDYAMDEEAFKQIVTYFDSAHRSWTGAVLGEDRNDDKLTFNSVVEKQFGGVFSHDEFLEFGKTAWGWGDEHRAWHHKQLWKSFMRYDDDHWSSVGYFCGIPEKDYNGVSEDVGDMMTTHEVRIYSGADPVFDEGDIFRLTVPLDDDYSPENGRLQKLQTIQAGVQQTRQHGGFQESSDALRQTAVADNEPYNDTYKEPDNEPHNEETLTPSERKFLSFVVQTGSLSAAELRTLMCVRNVSDFHARYIRPMLKRGLIEHTLPNAKRSKFQKYRLTRRGHAVVENVKRSRKEVNQ